MSKRRSPSLDDHEPSQSPALPSVEALQHTQTFTGPRDTQAAYDHPPLALRQSTEPRDEDSRGFKSPGFSLIQPSRPSHSSRPSRPSRLSRPSHASHNSHHSHHSYTSQLSHPSSILRTPYFPRPSRLLQTSHSDAIQTYQALSDQSLSTQQS